MNKILLYLIIMCHMALVLFIVITPFCGSNYLLLMHSIVVPFIMMHWLLNDNTCALTLAEQKIREQISGKPCDKNECFTCKLIDPVYDFKQNNIDSSTTIYAMTTILWLISVGKLCFKWYNGEIQNMDDLFL